MQLLADIQAQAHLGLWITATGLLLVMLLCMFAPESASKR